MITLIKLGVYIGLTKINFNNLCYDELHLTLIEYIADNFFEMKKFVKIEMIILFIPVFTFILYCVVYLLSKNKDLQIENTTTDEGFTTDFDYIKQDNLSSAPINYN